MSNDTKNANMNERGGSGKNDPNRPNDTAKAGQQSQDASHQQNEKSRQQSASDQNSGQQSQGGSHQDSGGVKQGGSGPGAREQKQANDLAHKGGQSK